MGLDTYLCSKIEDIEDATSEQCAYWRKCYGVNKWLRSHSIEIDNSDYMKLNLTKDELNELLNEMSKKITKIANKLNSLGYDVETIDDVREVVSNIYNTSDANDYFEVEKIIKSFNYMYLNYNSFADSIWSSVTTFIRTYIELSKLINADTIYFLES